jgi:protein TonB
MTEGLAYQPKRTSPTALTLVILLHGAAISALVLSKMDVVAKLKPVDTDVIFVDPIKPPPPDRSEAVEPPRQRIEVTYTPPIVKMPIADPPDLPTIEMTRPPVLEAFPGPRIEPLPSPPPSPPPPKKVKPARAKANLASYVSDADYPASAIRSEEAGTTRFRLSVGANGRVEQCEVTASSGSSALDSATCRIMKSRAKFTPARDSDGRATGDQVSSAIKWVLPRD